MDSSHFDRIAPLYDATIPPHVSRHLLARRGGMIASLLPVPGARILDVGCGTGRLVHLLCGKGYRAEGLDASPGMLEIARRGPGRFHLHDITGGVPTEGGYDLTMCVALLHHLHTTERVAACLKGMVASTARKGLILVMDNNPLNPYWRLYMRRLPQDQERTRMVGFREISRGLATAGAAISWNRPMGWMPDFTPTFLVPAMAGLEKVFERTPVFRRFAACNTVLARRRE